MAENDGGVEKISDKVKEVWNSCKSEFSIEEMSYNDGGVEKKTLLNNHMRTHIKDKVYNCDKCGITVGTKVLMEKHVKTHTTNSLSCEECKEEFSNRTNFNKHHQNFHSHQPENCNTCQRKEVIKILIKSLTDSINKMDH